MREFQHTQDYRLALASISVHGNPLILIKPCTVIKHLFFLIESPPYQRFVLERNKQEFAFSKACHNKICNQWAKGKEASLYCSR